MKILKIVLFIVLGLVGLFIVIGLVAPKSYHVERSITIDAPKPLVKDQVVKFANFREWEPWGKADPNLKVTIEGEDGQVGAVYSWEGNEDVGKGKQEIKTITNDRVDIELTFTEPWESEDGTYYTFKEDDDGKTTITWGMNGSSPFPMNVMMMAMNVEKMIGEDYDEGLNNLKERCEKMASEKTFGGYEINTADLSPRTYVMKRETIKWSEMQPFYAEHLKSIMTAVQAQSLEMAGAPSGVYFGWDEVNQQTDMGAAIPVTGEAEVAGYESVLIQGKALHIAYYGDYEGLEKPHMAMDEYLKAHGMEPSEIVVEEYVTDPMQESDTTKWLTNIYYIL